MKRSQERVSKFTPIFFSEIDPWFEQVIRVIQQLPVSATRWQHGQKYILLLLFGEK
jgi:hypothetical protein